MIDGSYNGGVLSIREGIHSLIPFVSTHHIVLILGDMRELGHESDALHADLAHTIKTSLDAYHNRISVFLV